MSDKHTQRSAIIGHAARAAANAIMDDIGEGITVMVIVTACDGLYVISNAPGDVQVDMMQRAIDATNQQRQIFTPIAKVN